jgi:hypothetical protein
LQLPPAYPKWQGEFEVDDYRRKQTKKQTISDPVLCSLKIEYGLPFF